jgi:hypothetical protein
MPSADEIIQIDEDDLGTEWAAQPGLMYRWSVKEADARHRHAQLKARLDLTAAELGLAMRLTPADYNLPPKPSNDLVKEAVIANEDFQRWLKKLNEAKHELDVFAAAVFAVEHKKKALEKMVELHSTNYYSEPRVPKTTRGDNGFTESVDKGVKKFSRRGAKRKARP